MGETQGIDCSRRMARAVGGGGEDAVAGQGASGAGRRAAATVCGVLHAAAGITSLRANINGCRSNRLSTSALSRLYTKEAKNWAWSDKFSNQRRAMCYYGVQNWLTVEASD